MIAIYPGGGPNLRLPVASLITLRNAWNSSEHTGIGERRGVGAGPTGTAIGCIEAATEGNLKGE